MIRCDYAHADSQAGGDPMLYNTEPLLLNAYSTICEIRGANNLVAKRTAQSLIELYEAQNLSDKANDWRARSAERR